LRRLVTKQANPRIIELANGVAKVLSGPIVNYEDLEIDLLLTEHAE
jgi:hypothetical protein